MKIDEISNLTSGLNTPNKSEQKNINDNSFSKVLTKAIDELNDTQVKADKAVAELATGQVTDLHQAAIAIGKAETSMNLMLEIRNKAISAYKEISRTQL
nr:flagellar hook-basal body complex protein FliE [Campylobacter sp.]